MTSNKGIFRMTRVKQSLRSPLRTSRNLSTVAVCALVMSGCIVSPKPFSVQ
jgi:hypothetical protein